MRDEMERARKRVLKKAKYESNRKVEPMGFLLSEYIGSVNWSSDVEDANAVLIYNDEYPDREPSSRAKYVVGNRLFIVVESSSCASEISLQQSEVISYINSRFGREVIKGLKFHIGSVG